MMVENEEKIKDEIWKKFLRRHWKVTLGFIAGAVGAVIAAVFVYLWRLADSQATGLVPQLLGNWTVGYIITFILNIILWEFLLVGIPVIAAAAVIFLQWWRKLPEEEREEYEGRPKKNRNRRRVFMGGSGGGLIPFVVIITWLIVVWVGGDWNTLFANWWIDDLVDYFIYAFLWDLLIFGVPAIIAGIWWLHRELKEKP